jgi:hypothetical protein
MSKVYEALEALIGDFKGSGIEVVDPASIHP